MSPPFFQSSTVVLLDHGLEALLRELSPTNGVAQILGLEQRPLLTARAANVRRWVASQLGPPRPRKPGQRPATDLRPLACGVRFAPTTGSFEQRVTYERWMAPLVPLEKRADLEPPAWLHLNPAERFPRLSPRTSVGAHVYGPWRDKASAERALRALEKSLRLRPCDFVFEPHPELQLGLGCFYAQVRTCSAPCLERVDVAGYQDLAQQALRLLTDPARRSAEVQAFLPAHCGPANGRALVVEIGRDGADLFPVLAGSVLAEEARRVPAQELDTALAALRWDREAQAGCDWVWLANWLYAPRRAGQWLHLRPDEDARALAARVRVVT